MGDPWTWIAAERRTLADLVDELDDAELATPSLCAGWTVRDVVAHLTLSLTFKPSKVLSASVRSGFRLNRSVLLLTAEAAERSTAELVALLRDHADTQWNPPGFGPGAPLTDILVHGVDLRLPLGRTHTPDPDALRYGLDFIVKPKAGAGFTQRRSQRGLHFTATDLDWTSGAGPTVEGPGLPLLAALCNRPAVLDQLTGDGVEVLRSRVA